MKKFKPNKTEKKCSKCGIVKPKSEYYVSHRKNVDGVDKIYLNGPCRLCAKISMEIYRKLVGYKYVAQSKTKSNIKIEYWNSVITFIDGTKVSITTGCSREEEIALLKNGFVHIINYDGRDYKKS